MVHYPEIQKKMKDMDVEMLAGTPKGLTARMDADMVHRTNVIESANIKID